MKIVHIITDLDTGGAEMMLYKLLSRIDRKIFEVKVISLMDAGSIRKQIEALNISVFSIGMRRGLPSPSAIWKLIKIIRKLQPDLIQGWMCHANIVSLLASFFSANSTPVVWSVRQSVYSLTFEERMTRYIIRLSSMLSPLAKIIIYNSRISSVQHEKIGFNSKRTVIIPNGFDCNQFRPQRTAHVVLRRRLGLNENTRLIGVIGRYHPMKDHNTFFHALAEPKLSNTGVHAVLLGHSMDNGNSAIVNTIARLGIKNRVHLLGECKDVSEIMAGLDISVSSSFTEAFPNVIAEAMASAVPCVVTDVGDSAWIIGNTGLVVPPREPKALSEACESLLEMSEGERKHLGLCARERIMDKFSLDNIVHRYESLYKQVLSES